MVVKEDEEPQILAINTARRISAIAIINSLLPLSLNVEGSVLDIDGIKVERDSPPARQLTSHILKHSSACNARKTRARVK